VFSTLLEQAQTLQRSLKAVAQPGQPGLEPPLAEALALVSACHQQMLALADTHRDQALAHALAGFELIEQLQHQPQPDWLAVLEEQYCRYGAIWIHAQAQNNDTLPADQVRQGLRLLARLKQLHDEPLPWIEVLRSDLRNHLNSLAAAATGQQPRLVVVGNCQAHPLLLGLRDALPDAAIHCCPAVHLATADDVARLHQRLASADLLVMHRVQPGYREGIGLDNQTLASLLPPGGRACILPNLHYEGHHPWIGYASDPTQRLHAIQPESPLGDYHDFLAMVAAARGLEPQRLLASPCPAALIPLLQDAHQSSLSALQSRERDCDVPISDWISQVYPQHPLMHTINHPTQVLLQELLRRLLAHLGWPESWDPQRLDSHEYLGELSIPVHPWVSEALRLEAWSAAWGQRQGAPFAIEAQLQASMAFYQRHPWILEANASHPKAAFANRLLASLAAPSGATTAGPIPYAFLDPRHHFQADEFQAREHQPAASPPAAPPWDLPLHTYRIGWRLEPQATVLPVGVITQQGWLSDCLQYLPPQWPQAEWLGTIAGYQLVSSGDRLELRQQHAAPQRHLAGRWCVLNDIVAHRNVGHFFQDLLPQLMAIRRLRQRWPDLQVLGTVERYPSLRILRELVLDAGWQPRPPEPRVEVDELILQPLAFNGGIGFAARPSHDWWLALDDLRDGLSLLRQKLAPDPAALWRGHWVCFSRDLAAATEAPQGRHFSNYPQLLEQLSNAGVLILDPGCHGIRELQVLVAGARGFVGIHGAGLYNALLGPAEARVVEIRPACGCWRCLELLTLAAGLDWQPISCQPDPSHPGRSVIPIEAVLAQLD
jgi:hypothetical protein